MEPTKETEQTQAKPTEAIDQDMPSLEEQRNNHHQRNLNTNNLLADHLDGSSLKRSNSYGVLYYYGSAWQWTSFETALLCFFVCALQRSNSADTAPNTVWTIVNCFNKK